MSLVTGSRLGPYEIVAPLGAGGMGEVWRARDTRLDRTVAIKVLAGSLAADPQFRERFDREARTISKLTHPHICTLHDVGEHAGTAFLVMEFLEGETLADRLTRASSKGAGLPYAEALAIAIQIADALTAAHGAGVVHRDLKPGNVMLTKTGAKLLDFGLAKTAAPAIAAIGATVLPTTPPQTLTAHGTILGTFQYMAPEQVEGAEADARSDIFAFGCVLYEMFTGQKAFDATTHASLIAAILEREPPPVTARQPLAPALVDAIVRKCLAKKAHDRWQSAADLGSALRWAADNVAVAAPDAAGIARTESHRWARIAAGLAALAVVLAIGAPAWRYWSEPPPAGTIRFEVFAPADAMFAPAPVAAAAQLALSPDGRRLAFVAAPRHGASRIWIRPIDGVQAQALADTEGAAFPFWSPDGRFIGFFAGGKLKKIDVAGGVSQPIADASNGRGGAWSPDDTIVFAGGSYSALSKVSAAGGPVTPATNLDVGQGAIAHYWPEFLPDGRRFLFYQRTPNTDFEGIFVGTLDGPTTSRVVQARARALYSQEHLLSVRDGMLFAQAFDARALEASGEPIRVGNNVGYFQSSFGYAAVTASPTGALAYGPTVAPATSLRWYDRTGRAAGSAAVPGIYTGPRLSPDQKMVAMSVRQQGSWMADIWVLDLARNTVSRSTFDPANEWFPAWSFDGSRMFFGSSRGGSTAMFERVGVGNEALLTRDTKDVAIYPADASTDGRWLLYIESNKSGYDLGVVALTGERKLNPLVTTPFNEVQGRFSPNGRWVAYASDESGKFEVYVRPFPAANGQWRISIAGGMQPEWRRDGQELFYISSDGKLMALPVTTEGAAFNAGVPRALFDVEVPEASQPYPGHYAVSADGQRFLVNTLIDQPTRPALTVVLNWAAELRK